MSTPPGAPERYLEVARDEAPAKFRLAGSLPVDFDPSAGYEELWDLHAESVERLGEAESGEEADGSLLDLKAELGRRIVGRCTLCRHRCRVDRTGGKTGVCGVGSEPMISSEFLHLGEEPEISPSHTVFFGGCALRCKFCQNHSIARLEEDFSSPSPRDLAHRIELKRRNDSRNVNWVGGDPTPHLPYVLETLGHVDVNVPSVWNSNMYLSEDSMELLRGTQDLFLTDLKYGNDECAFELSSALDYWDTVTGNHLAAQHQAELVVRHLVLPGHVECCTRPILEWTAGELGRDTRFNLMFQYRPEHEANERDGIDRGLTREERETARRSAEDAGMTNLV